MTIAATCATLFRRATFLPFFLLTACAAPGPDHNIVFDADDCPACQSVFPKGNWQFVHEVVFHFRAGEGRFLGVVVLDGDELRCALTTLEGLTVFSAQASILPDGPVEVKRALPPLDKPGFATGLLADLRLLFTAPSGMPRCGWRHGERLCRWQNTGTVEDVAISEANCWTIQAFRDERLVRTARADTCADRDGYALPGVIFLRASGDADYQLEMRLINAEKTGQ